LAKSAILVCSTLLQESPLFPELENHQELDALTKAMLSSTASSSSPMKAPLRWGMRLGPIPSNIVCPRLPFDQTASKKAADTCSPLRRLLGANLTVCQLRQTTYVTILGNANPD
jgi:hypothetical protein